MRRSQQKPSRRSRPPRVRRNEREIHGTVTRQTLNGSPTVHRRPAKANVAIAAWIRMASTMLDHDSAMTIAFMVFETVPRGEPNRVPT